MSAMGGLNGKPRLYGAERHDGIRLVAGRAVRADEVPPAGSALHAHHEVSPA